MRVARWRPGHLPFFAVQPEAEPLTQTSEPVDEEPRLAGAREIVRGAWIPHELHRYALLLEPDEPLLRVGHRRAVIFFRLHDERRRLHVADVTNGRERVVHDGVVPWLAIELELGEPLRVGRAVPRPPVADHAVVLRGLESV